MLQKLRENRSLQGFLLVSPTLLWLLLLLILPLALTVITSFGGRSTDGNVIYGFSLTNYLRIFGLGGEDFDPFYLRVVGQSLWLALISTMAPPCSSSGLEMSSHTTSTPQMSRPATFAAMMT